MAKPSFQDVFKLMNSLGSFEELLDATALKPETCVSLGIHEKFKQLYEKLGKYVQHEETKDLTFKSICNICGNEIKILNCDVRTSVAIHNAGESHKVATKLMDINKHDHDFGGNSVHQQSVDLKIVRNDDILKQASELPSTTTADTQVDTKKWNLNLETKSLHLLDFNNVPNESIKSTGEITNNIAAQNIEVKIKSQDSDLETKSVVQLIDFLNNVPNELLKPTSNANSILQNEGFVSNNLNANVPSPCTSCQQVFCICGYKDKTMQLLNEKMSNVNFSQHGGTGTYCEPPSLPGNYSVPPPPLFPGGIPPQGLKQPYANTRGRNPLPQSHNNRKPQGERRSSSMSTGPVENNSPRQYLNVHVHMQPPVDQSAQAYTQPVAAPHRQSQTKINIHAHMPPPVADPHHRAQTKKNTVEENLELLRSKTLGHDEEMQLMYKMLRQAEAGYWRRGHFTKVYNREHGRNEYVCNICNTGSRMNCSLHVVQHARGKSHQEVLRSERSDEREDDDDRSECVVM